MKVTACLVIHNEEAVIERCLKSIEGAVDKILVVHDGSCSDNSLEICRKYHYKVFVRDFIGEAEPHRTWLYNQAKTEWILKIDADEFLSKELKKQIPKLIQDNQVSCYEFLWRYNNGKQYKTTSWPWKKVLFRKDSFHFLAFPHEEEIPEGSIKKIPLLLEHKPSYDNFSFNSFRHKWQKWIRVHAQYLLKDPSTLDRFPNDKKNLLPHYYFIIQHPLLYGLPLGIYHFLGTFLLGGYKESLTGLKMCLMMGAYYSFLCIEVYKQKQALKWHDPSKKE